MQWSLALGLLLMAPALAGCLAEQADPPGGAAADDGRDAAPLSNATTGARPGGGGGDDGVDPTVSSQGNGSLGNASGPPREWAALGMATIRPGVQVVADGSQCTSNFLFTSPDNSTVYLGFAAHCVTRNDPNSADDGCDPSSDPLPIGTRLEIEGADHPATLAYTSWGTMQAAGGASSAECTYNDFALAELDPRDAAKANPAMLFFGGPTALADPGGVGTLDKILTYGDSGLRAGLSALSPHEGYVISSPGSNGWTTQVYTVPQGIPGDSGSGVLLGADGSALGVLVTISLIGGSNGVTTLANALAYAAEKGDTPAVLATADVLDTGILP